MADSAARPLKVVRILARMNTGGPAQHVAVLADGLTERGHEHHLMFGSIESDEGDMSDLLTGRSGHLALVRSMRRSISLKDDLCAVVQVYRFIRQVRPDVVHTHTAKAGLIGRIAAWAARTPVVIHTYHGHVFQGYFGRLQTRVHLAVERWLAKRTTKLITLSPQLQSELCDTYKIGTEDQYELVNLGLPLNHYRGCERGKLRAELNLSDCAVLVGSVGRIVPIKDFPLLVRAFAELDASQDYHLVVAGDGDGRSELLQLVDQLGLRDRVHLLGWREDIRNIISSLDVFVLASKNEGTPVSIIEAMAAGTPVAATAVGGVADLLEQGVGGELAFSRDPGELADAITRAAKVGRGGHEGRAAVIDTFSTALLVSRLEALMKELRAAASAA